MKQITVAVAGCGSRGFDAYASYQAKHPDEMKIVAAADTRPERLQMMREKFGLTEEQALTARKKCWRSQEWRTRC